jgi:hypothetical protein
MVLAEKLAHLVRRAANRSGVGRGVSGVLARVKRFAPTVGAAVLMVVLGIGGFLFGLSGGPSPVAQSQTGTSSHAPRGPHGRVVDARLAESPGNAAEQLGAGAPVALPVATTAPAATPAVLASAPPLAARENFAFAPYWTLPQSASFDITGLSTLAYFSIGVNPDGTLAESGAGWDGFESQALADLITRAHAAGERVVLTVNDFGQGSLDALTSSPTAAATLSSTLIPLLQSKSLDGVNFDFEGDGSRDQVGLTNLVTAVSGALRTADPHWQITMDTYASSAGDANGFYNIPALAPAVDAFFVMAYEENLKGVSSAASPLTSGMFSDLTTLKQYAAAVPASKVILGTPFFGIDWPTANGTMAANATGGAADVADAQAQAAGPAYWDPVTDTGWTSYQVGGQWHETYFESPYGLYEVSQLASYFGARGVGIWALGMEGNGAEMIAALDGMVPPGGPGGTGPAVTSASPAAPSTASPATPVAVAAPAAATTTTTRPPAATTTTAAPGVANGTNAPTTSTTSTTLAGSTSAVRNGARVVLTPVAASQVSNLSQEGTVTDFQSTDPAFSCLDGATLNVYWNLLGHAAAEAATPTNCVTQDFELPS